jgi:hypothetical protein
MIAKRLKEQMEKENDFLGQTKKCIREFADEIQIHIMRVGILMWLYTQANCFPSITNQFPIEINEEEIKPYWIEFLMGALVVTWTCLWIKRQITGKKHIKLNDIIDFVLCLWYLYKDIIFTAEFAGLITVKNKRRDRERKPTHSNLTS